MLVLSQRHIEGGWTVYLCVTEGGHPLCQLVKAGFIRFNTNVLAQLWGTILDHISIKYPFSCQE